MPKRRSLHKFWDEEDSLSFFLWLLVIFVFVISPLSQSLPKFRILIDLSFGVVLISGIGTTIESPKVVRLAVLLVLLAVGSSITEVLIDEGHSFRVFSKMCDIAALILLLLVALKQTLKDGPITAHRVKGAVATYIVFAVLWAKMYHLAILVKPAAFSGVDPTDPFLSLMYFSFVTLATVGYGDILPTDVFTRALSNAEALIGQLFPAIFIARLVSLQIDPRKR